jgi:hypothetical protein
MTTEAPAARHPRRHRLPALAVVGMSLLLAACGGHLAVPTLTTTRTNGGSLTVTQADKGKTVRVGVPAQVTVDLPVQTSKGDTWRLVSGGPGFAAAGPSQFTPNPGQADQSLEILRYTASQAGTFPLVFDLAPAGSLTKAPTAQFRVTLHAG